MTDPLDSPFGGECQRCGIAWDRLYRRARNGLLCRNCIDLDRTGLTPRDSGRMPATRQKEGVDPYSQPVTVNMFGKREPCIWCQADATPKYTWEDGQITACGWAHAGLFMDAEIDRILGPMLDPWDEQYVKRSLGLTDG